MSKVKITWKAFGDKPERGRFISSVEFETEFAMTDIFWQKLWLMKTNFKEYGVALKGTFSIHYL